MIFHDPKLEALLKHCKAYGSASAYKKQTRGSPIDYAYCQFPNLQNAKWPIPHNFKVSLAPSIYNWSSFLVISLTISQLRHTNKVYLRRRYILEVTAASINCGRTAVNS